MTAEIFPGQARGRVTVPPSKSIAHRYLICAALAEGESVIHHVPASDDLLATCDALSALGVFIAWEGDTVRVRGTKRLVPTKELACRECGTTLRLMLPLCLLGEGEATLTGTPKLISRPLGVYERLCEEDGFSFLRGHDRVTVSGCLTPGVYRIPGNVSSQFVSGLLLALSRLEGDSVIEMTTEVESRSYIGLTLDAMAAFGVNAEWTGERSLKVPGGKSYCAGEHAVEGDWSSAAFFEALTALGDPVTVEGVTIASHQSDKACRTYFEALRADTPTLSVRDCPDLAPILMTVAALSHGATLTDTARLKLKESDRGRAMAQELAKCGIRTIQEENSITVLSGTPVPPSEPLFGHNDHRIVMALAILLTRVGGVIRNAEAVSKSYPEFFDHLAALQIKVETDKRNA